MALDIGAEIKAWIGSHLGLDPADLRSIGGRVRAWLRDSSAQPVYGPPIQGVCTVDANGYGTIKLLTAPQGRRFIVHQLIAGGLFANTTANGNVLAVVAANDPPVDTQVPTTQIVDILTLPMPKPAFYSRGHFVVLPGESLFMLFYGATSGQQYCAACNSFVSEPMGS